jgi:hypothetical protein
MVESEIFLKCLVYHAIKASSTNSLVPIGTLTITIPFVASGISQSSGSCCSAKELGAAKQVPFWTISNEIHYKKKTKANNAQRIKKGEHLRTEGYNGEKAGNSEEEGNEGDGREPREEA